MNLINQMLLVVKILINAHFFIHLFFYICRVLQPCFSLDNWSVYLNSISLSFSCFLSFSDVEFLSVSVHNSELFVLHVCTIKPICILETLSYDCLSLQQIALELH